MDADDEIFDISKLSFDGDFECQVQELLQYVRLTRDQVEHLQLLFDDLQHTLQVEWQGCRVLAFGSIVTGLGIKTSDVDCYIDLPRWVTPANEESVIRARNILRRRSHIFQNLFAIISAKVPIVKFYHAPTGRNCDISFKSPAGVENSKLLAYLLQADKRILPLTIIVKYWSKVHNLTGTNLMPNYALILLVIFYLQQRAILPPILYLQRNVEPLMVSDWNVAFTAALHVNTNKESLFQLLSGFFKYYTTFDYQKFVISPYLGRAMERKLFGSLETVPDDFILYKNNVASRICKPIRLDSLMCIQDPFEHCRNCAVAVHPKLGNAVIMSCERAARAADGEEREYLRSILTRINVTTVNKKKKKSQKRGVVALIGKHKNNRNRQMTQKIKNHVVINGFRR